MATKKLNPFATTADNSASRIAVEVPPVATSVEERACNGCHLANLIADILDAHIDVHGPSGRLEELVFLAGLAKENATALRSAVAA